MSIRIKEPAARRRTLVLVAGSVWVAVGIVLAAAAAVWLGTTEAVYLIIAAVSLLVGLLISRFAFSRLIRKNLHRIRTLSPHKPRVCVFAFQAVESYFLVLVMMAVGYILRHLPLPHVYVAIIYLTIGVALIKSGIDYLKASREFTPDT
ncbi:MAG: hypothetical protein JSV52_06335 [Candidatus Zixiibacteriota bacterium]|nr:MAG: hypothetical protein JSV52_06335 [candidate division Zixibacteria bacterium]